VKCEGYCEMCPDDVFVKCECEWDKCDCGKRAVWLYMPDTDEKGGNDYYCDDCVPRGCSCNLEPKDNNYENQSPDNWYQPLDDKGREFPCCEFFYIGEDHGQ